MAVVEILKQESRRTIAAVHGKNMAAGRLFDARAVKVQRNYGDTGSQDCQLHNCLN
jgi:hypothetical protein